MRCFRSLVFSAVVAVVVAGASAPLPAQTTPTAPTQTDPADTFFDDSVVHDVYLRISSRDWQSLKVHYLDNDYYTCDFQWRDRTLRNIAIRSRGTGSRSGIKPGLRVDFDRNTTGQTFLGLKSFILRNNTQDPSNMHERIAMQFFRRMGLPAPREAHTRLYVNDVYVGMYTIVESVDKTFLRKNFDEDNGDLYKYDYNTDDKPYYLEYRGSDPALYVPHPFKPETNESHPRSEIVADMIRTINQDSDTIFKQTIAPYLGDLKKFIKHIAVEMFLADNDGFNGNYGTNNFYLYRYDSQSLFAFVAWDKSNTFIDGPTYPIFHDVYDQPDSKRNRLTMRVLGFDDLKNLYLDTLLACATALNATLDAVPPATSPADPRGWMEREIEREYAQIKVGVYADPQKEYTNEAFEKEVENLRNFARKRSDFVRTEIAKARPQ
jgi:spore coat protein CotH